MHRPERRAQPGRLALLTLAIAAVGSVVVAGGSPGATAVAAEVPRASEEPSISVAPEASTVLMPSGSASAPSAGASESAPPAPSAPTSTPSIVPSASTPPATPAPASSPSPSKAALAPSVATTPAPGASPVPTGTYPSQCVGWSPARERADALLENRYRINVHPVVTIPVDPTWTENPLNDANWEYQFHSQWLLLSLFQTWHSTADARYLDKAADVLRDWWEDNPRSAPRSPVAWDKMGTALRAQVLACAWQFLPHSTWLTEAIDEHGRVLASSTFYAIEGNWALNQNLGLLEIAIVRGRADWRTIARDRLAALFERSVDSQGVTNEQSVYYQAYNYDRYRLAFARLAAAGLALPTTAARLNLMPGFLGHATLPNGEYQMIGDTDRMAARTLAGTAAEFAATKGVSGIRPTATVAVYRAGWLFARTGWGEKRPYGDEVNVALRWGPAPIIHGHADAGSITLYGYGARLLVDPGKYTYNWNAWRAWFKGRTSHNVVTVDGIAYVREKGSRLLSHSNSSTMVTARVEMLGNTGVTHIRGMTFSRNLGYVLVEDRLTSSRTRTYRQLWHLTEDARPDVQATWFRTQRTRGNVQVRQLIGGTTSRILSGRTSPIQGWLAWEHGKRIAAPTVEVVRSGASTRFLTLLLTAPGTPASGVSELKLTSTGYSVIVKVGANRERVVVSGSSVTITALP